MKNWVKLCMYLIVTTFCAVAFFAFGMLWTIVPLTLLSFLGVFYAPIPKILFFNIDEKVQKESLEKELAISYKHTLYAVAKKKFLKGSLVKVLIWRSPCSTITGAKRRTYCGSFVGENIINLS